MQCQRHALYAVAQKMNTQHIRRCRARTWKKGLRGTGQSLYVSQSIQFLSLFPRLGITTKERAVASLRFNVSRTKKPDKLNALSK